MPNRTPSAGAITGSSGDRGRRFMSPGRRRVEPEAEGEQDVDGEVDPQDLQRQQRRAVGDGEDPGTDEQQDEPGQHDHLDPDVLHQVVVEASTALDGGDDGGEVVVGEDHLGGVLGDLGAGDPHRHADVRSGERRRIVHAVARHGDDVPLLLEDADQPHLVLGRHSGDDADAVDLGFELVVGKGGELGAGERASFDAELAGDRGGGRGVVAGDHADADAGVLAEGDGVLGLLARRVDDADEGEQLELGDQRQQVARRVERTPGRSRAWRRPAPACRRLPAGRSRPAPDRSSRPSAPSIRPQPDSGTSGPTGRRALP